MSTIKAKEWVDLPKGYTGIVEWENGNKGWYKNGIYHRENGPAYISFNSYKEWCLDGEYVWHSTKKLNLINQIVLSKTQHPKYPTVQIWKVLDSGKVYELTIIPGMEEFIIE